MGLYLATSEKASEHARLRQAGAKILCRSLSYMYTNEGGIVLKKSLLLVLFPALAATAWTLIESEVAAKSADRGPHEASLETRPAPPAATEPGSAGPGVADQALAIDDLSAELRREDGELLVVIDPGHGGTNTGAPGVERGFYEKELTLALARGVAERLEGQGVRVVLTRERDVYVSLRQRVRQANRLGADLFVSVHANATEAHLRRGFETFILSPRGVDIDGRALRIADGSVRGDLDRQTAQILDDVERGMAQPNAAALAAEIQNQLRASRGPSGDRGVRQDIMHVLLGATMPAVLVEVGFIDHAAEGQELRDPAVQAELCDALATAIHRAVALPSS